MKKVFNTFILLGLSAWAGVQAQTPIIDSIFMGPGYANQIYYSLGNGQVGAQVAANWHIAVSVQPSIPPTQTLQGTTIRINGGYGVEVYKVTDTDSAGFSALNNTNNLSNWQQLRDGYTNWDEGCLNSTRSSSNPFDYGWGIYQGNPSYNVVGDSIYVLKIGNSTYKKMWVKVLQFDTLWKIIIADLDNSNIQNLIFSKAGPGLQGKNFVYINALTGEVNNSEPAGPWDLLFGRYVSQVAPGMFYPVTGVLTNKPVKSVRAYPVDINTVSYSAYEASLSSDISTIGYDWKVFANNVFTMVDSLVYYVKSANGSVYRLRFLDFRANDGMAKFELIPQGTVGIRDISNHSLSAFPNPAQNILNIISADNLEQIIITDLSGRVMLSSNEINARQTSLPVNDLAPGVYFVQCIQNGMRSTIKFVKQ